jgi:hypothetical protein
MKLLVPAIVCAIGWPVVATTPCLTPEAAMAVAESATLGEAVSAHRIVTHTAGFGEWAVLVHMPGEDQGWRCVISRDSGKVLRKKRIQNPPSKVR